MNPDLIIAAVIAMEKSARSAATLGFLRFAKAIQVLPPVSAAMRGSTRFATGLASPSQTSSSSGDAMAEPVRIHINREPYQSPNPTAGEALYALAGIPKDEKLYREIGEKDKEDILIPRDQAHVHLKEDEHFYSQKVFSIFVNTDEHDVEKKEISYAQVVDLYLGSGGEPSTEYLVKYSHGPAENPSGVLAVDQKVKVKDDMRFRVTGTGES